MKKNENFRASMDNEARLKALGRGVNSPFKMQDLSGDGKVTKKDVLIGRGVIDKSGSPLKMKNPCWKGYEAIGMKTLKGKKVPNCVPKK